jgi:hypothetical protein
MLAVTGAALVEISPKRKWGPWISRRERALAQMLIGALIGYCVAGFFVSAEYFAYLYFMLALAVGLTKVIRARAAAFPIARSRINVRLAPRTPLADADLSWVSGSIESSIRDTAPKR